MIFSIEPPSSEDEIPLDPNELTTVPTSSLDALPISEELRPASSRFDTEAVVIFLKMVSYAVNPESTELSGRYWFRPFTDLTMLLTITLMTFIASSESDNPMDANFD